MEANSIEVSALLIFVLGSVLPVIEFFNVVWMSKGRLNWVLALVLLVIVASELLVLCAAYVAQKKGNSNSR